MAIHSLKASALAAALLGVASLPAQRAAAEDAAPQREITLDIQGAVFERGTAIEINSNTTLSLEGAGGTLEPGAGIVPHSVVEAGDGWDVPCEDPNMAIKFQENSLLQACSRIEKDNTSTEKEAYTDLPNFAELDTFLTIDSPFIHKGVQLLDKTGTPLTEEQRAQHILSTTDSDPSLFADSTTLVHLIANTGEHNQLGAPKIIIDSSKSSSTILTLSASFGSAKGADETGKKVCPIVITGTKQTSFKDSNNQHYTNGLVVIDGGAHAEFWKTSLPASDIIVNDAPTGQETRLSIHGGDTSLIRGQKITCGDHTVIGFYDATKILPGNRLIL